MSLSGHGYNTNQGVQWLCLIVKLIQYRSSIKSISMSGCFSQVRLWTYHKRFYWLNSVEKVHREHGWYHFMDWVHDIGREQSKLVLLSSYALISFFSPDLGYDTVAILNSFHLDFPAVMDCKLKLWAKINPFSLKSVFVSIFYHSNRMIKCVCSADWIVVFSATRNF